MSERPPIARWSGNYDRADHTESRPEKAPTLGWSDFHGANPSGATDAGRDDPAPTSGRVDPAQARKIG